MKLRVARRVGQSGLLTYHVRVSMMVSIGGSETHRPTLRLGQNPQVTPQVEAILLILAQQTKALLAKGIQMILGLIDRKSFRTAYLKPALLQGWVEYTLPDKPTSPLQRYRLTVKGIAQAREYMNRDVT